MEQETVTEILRQTKDKMQALEKSLGETQWYLGEEKAKNQRLENDLQGKDQYIQRLEGDLRKLKQQFDESQWYLAEERSKREESGRALKDAVGRCQDLESQLNQIRMQLQATQNELRGEQLFWGGIKSKQLK